MAAVLRFWGLGRQGLWYDEAQTGWMLRGSFGQMLAGVSHSESTPPVYYALAWCWVRVFGDTREGLRSLSALAGVLTVPLAWASARELLERRAGLTVALLVAVNPLLIWYSQEARAYALYVLTGTLAFWLFVRARADPTTRRIGLWTVACVAAISVHYFAAFLILPQALLLVRETGFRRPVRWSLAVMAVATLPLIALAASQAHHADWIHSVSLWWRVAQVGAYFAVGFIPPATLAVLAVTIVLLIAAAVVGLARVDAVQRAALTSAAAVAAGAVAIPLGLAVAGLDYFVVRNLLAGLIPAVIVLGGGLSARRAGAAGLVITGLLAVIGVGLVLALQEDPGAQRPNWPALAEALRRLPTPRVIEFDGGTRSWAKPLAFELRRTWWLHKTIRVREFDVIRRVPRRGPCGGRTWWGPACNLPSASHPAAPRLQLALGFHRLGEQYVAGFVITRFVASTPTAVPPVRGRSARSGAPGRPRLLASPVPEPAIL